MARVFEFPKLVPQDTLFPADAETWWPAIGNAEPGLCAGCWMVDIGLSVNRSADSPLTAKPLRDTKIHKLAETMLCGNSARIRNGPDGAGHTNAGAYHAPFLPEIEGEVPAILAAPHQGLTDAEIRDRQVGLLDERRRRCEVS